MNYEKNKNMISFEVYCQHISSSIIFIFMKSEAQITKQVYYIIFHQKMCSGGYITSVDQGIL